MSLTNDEVLWLSRKCWDRFELKKMQEMKILNSDFRLNNGCQTSRHSRLWLRQEVAEPVRRRLSGLFRRLLQGRKRTGGRAASSGHQSPTPARLELEEVRRRFAAHNADDVLIVVVGFDVGPRADEASVDDNSPASDVDWSNDVFDSTIDSRVDICNDDSSNSFDNVGGGAPEHISGRRSSKVRSQRSWARTSFPDQRDETRFETHQDRVGAAGWSGKIFLISPCYVYLQQSKFFFNFDYFPMGIVN